MCDSAVSDYSTVSRDCGQRRRRVVPCIELEDELTLSDMAPPKTPGAPRGTVQNTLFGIVTYSIRAIPLPPAISEFLLSHTTTIRRVVSQQLDTGAEALEGEEGDVDGTGEQTQSQAQDSVRQLSPEQFWDELEAVCQKGGGEWVGAADRIWSFGPKRMGSCLLLDPQGSSHLRWDTRDAFNEVKADLPRLRGRGQLIAKARAEGASAEQALASTDSAVVDEQLASLPEHLGTSPVDSTIGLANPNGVGESDAKADLRLLQDFENSIEAGFQMATFQGPLCSEPVVGMAWVVEKIGLHKEDESEYSSIICEDTGQRKFKR